MMDAIQIFLKYFLALDIGVLLGMLLTTWFIGSKGCYEECLLSDKQDDDSSGYWIKRLSRRKEDRCTHEQ